MSEATFQLGQKAFILNEKKQVLLVGMKKRANPDLVFWDFPGGRVDVGEGNLHEALNREMQEELTVAVEVHDLLSLSIAENRHSGRPPILLAVYHCSIKSGSIAPSNEILDYKWVHIDEVPKLPSSRYSIETVERIKARLDLN